MIYQQAALGNQQQDPPQSQPAPGPIPEDSGTAHTTWHIGDLNGRLAHQEGMLTELNEVGQQDLKETRTREGSVQIELIPSIKAPLQNNFKDKISARISTLMQPLSPKWTNSRVI